MNIRTLLERARECCRIAERMGEPFGEGYWSYQVSEEIDALLARIPNPVIVPREPTEAMLEAATELRLDEDGHYCSISKFEAIDIYRAMIAAVEKERT